MELPEDIIAEYNFTTLPAKELVDYLIHNFNALTLKSYKENQKFLTKNEIIAVLPSKIVEYYSQNTPKSTARPIPKSSPKSWVDDPQQVDKFNKFIAKCYQVSDKPDSKFKDVMTDYCLEEKLDYPCVWSSKYEELCHKLGIKYEKIVNPRFATSTGTCHLYLRSKSTKCRALCYIGEIPDLNVT